METHSLTLVEDPARLLYLEYLECLGLIAFECGDAAVDGEIAEDREPAENDGMAQDWIAVIEQLCQHWPNLDVVLVNGNVTRDVVASAFEHGVCDYFASPYDHKLLAERIHVLSRTRAQRQRNDAERGAGS